MTSRRRACCVAAATAATVLLLPSAAMAHGIVGKQNLPVPAWLFAWGAAIVLVASFVALATLWREPRLRQARGRELFTLPRFLEPVAGLIGIAAFCLVVYAGLAGVQNPQDNIAPTFIFVHLWVAVPFLSLLLGNWFSAFNPWRAIGRAVGWLAPRLGLGGVDPLPYPAWLGRWPAAAGILFFAWVELAYTGRSDPSDLATLALVYAAVQLLGMTVYGERQWTQNADPFAVYFGLFGRLAPIQWQDRRATLRSPASALSVLDMVPGTLALVLVSIGTTTFDGFTLGGVWSSIVQDLISFFRDVGLPNQQPISAAFTVGILAGVLVVSAFYRLGVAGMRSVDPDRTPGELARAFGHTLVPIAAAYVVAHYVGLLAYNGQAIGSLISDPLGDGSDLLGTAGSTVDYGWISANGIWYVQVAALVVGHVTGLVLAHDRALELYGDSRKATRSQYWMLTVMVGFTMLALYLISAPNAG